MKNRARISIHKITIKRFRSIKEITLTINDLASPIVICGANNSGKTNILRAINLFFNPNNYESEIDAPYHLKKGSGGSQDAVHPVIEIEFLDGERIIKIERKFDANGLVPEKANDFLESTKGFLKSINFLYIPSINVSFPELIKNLIDDVYNVEYANTRFSGSKRELKDVLARYYEGLEEILGILQRDINSLFRNYSESWGVAFSIKNNLQKVRDLITEDIEFYISDGKNASRHLEGKGSGLQRLAYILLCRRIIEKTTNRSSILVIDEPDVYLHPAFQKKLNQDLQDLSSDFSCQVFITTHSPTFISPRNTSNLFLIDIKSSEVSYRRKGDKEFTVFETINVDLNQTEGSRRIREYLGLDNQDVNLLSSYTVLVEGETDQVYLENLLDYFQLPKPEIFYLSGADNAEEKIRFFDSQYQYQEFKGYVRLILDNDEKGKKVKAEIERKKSNFLKINLTVDFIPTFLGVIPADSRPQNSIEDFLYPEVFFYILEKQLAKMGKKKISTKNQQDVIQKLCQRNRHFISKGILSVAEDLVNNADPETRIKFSGSSMKQQFSKIFKQLICNADRELVEKLRSGHEKYPTVFDFLKRISNHEDFL
jgi:predicted ATP-dependent endonuclease of OLD family